MTVSYADDSLTLHHGDSLDVLRSLPDASVDAVVTDPPYGLEFMGKEWDGADGFRRSLNPNDVGRDNAFGRTSRTSPEYRTASPRKRHLGHITSKCFACECGQDGEPGVDHAVTNDCRYDLHECAPECPTRTASKAQATARQEGGIRQATGPSFMGGLNPKCLVCDRWQRGSNPCRCESPEWTQERLVRLHSFQEWCEVWARECLRVLRPGGHMLAFGGTRTFHRLACAVEDAGFEIRDSIAWMYGSGFPKSLDVSKAIDRHLGAERAITREATRQLTPGDTISFDQRPSSERERRDDPVTAAAAAAWHGWGTALKPAFEPIVVARKPLSGTVAANVLAHGTGALNIDGCRVASSEADKAAINAKHAGMDAAAYERPAGTSLNLSVNPMALKPAQAHDLGRWPANVVLDESQAAALDEQSGESMSRVGKPRGADHGEGWGMTATGAEYDDQGGASRFFYVAKAGSGERVRVDGVAHPTVKPLSLMRWLVRLVTPPGGTVLEPFAGSGTTVEACILEGFRCIAIEREADYLPLIRARIQRQRDPVGYAQANHKDDGQPFFNFAGEESA